MRRGLLLSFCARLLSSAALLATSSASALAQGAATQPEAQSHVSAQARAYEQAMATRTALKVDEYGRVGHCDLTARLDNLAVLVQASPTLTAYVITRNPAGVNVDHARFHLDRARYYLTEERGLARERVVAIHGGSGEADEVRTELWVVPDGAEPPARPPDEALASKEFEGMLDSYATDADTFREEVEMGWPSYAVAFSDFADKLKRQPQSVGYLVVRPAKNSLPGVWRRVARRDEFILQNDYKVAADRLKSLNGAPSETDATTVELWVRPKSAPPPASAKEEAGARPKEAARLNTLELYDTPAEETERWMVENLAEYLRADKKARGVLVVRRLRPDEQQADETPEDSNATAEAAQKAAAEAAANDAPKETAGETTADAQTEEETEDWDALSVAEDWRKMLTEKYGIEPHRVLVMEGHTQAWNAGRIDTWVVPEGAALPDPFVVTKDEDEEALPVEGEGIAQEAAAEKKENTPPPFRK